MLRGGGVHGAGVTFIIYPLANTAAAGAEAAAEEATPGEGGGQSSEGGESQSKTKWGIVCLHSS